MGVRLGPDTTPAPRARCNLLVDRGGQWWTCKRLVGHRGRHARRPTFLERWLRLL